MDVISAYSLPLGETAAATAAQCGGKAWTLAALKAAGFAVPDGFVVTTAAFARFLAEGGLGANTTAAEALAAGIPEEVAAAVLDAYGRLGGLVAVRSSCVAEDLPDASYAGQYETVLGVEGQQRLLGALRQCWAAVFDGPAVAYRAVHGGDGVPPMAVLVQRMVPAEAAGVAFSAHPVSGDRDVVLINAVRGLADRLVSGGSDAEEWAVRGRSARAVAGADGVLDPARAVRVAELARKVERHRGTPQDIEWAEAGGEVYLLQARPITALAAPAGQRSEPSPVDVPPGFWEREASHAPAPLTPFTSAFYHRLVTDAIRDALGDFSLLLETIEMRGIGGWTYSRYVPVGGGTRKPPPAWLMPLLVRAMPALRTRIRRCEEAMRADLAGATVERWYSEWQPRLAARLAELHGVPRSRLSDEDALAHFRDALGLVDEAVRIHFRLHVAVGLALYSLAEASRELLGWEEGRVWSLLAGTSTMTTEPARRLAPLTRRIEASPALRRVLEEGGPQAVERLGRLAPDLAADFADYLERFGHRTFGIEVADPTLAEAPQLFLQLMAGQAAQGFEPGVEDALRAEGRAGVAAEAREALAARSPEQGERWRRALAAALRAYPVREDNAFYTTSGPLAVLRYAALEVGGRLAAAGRIAAAEDCFFLEPQELADALGGTGRVGELVEERRAAWSWSAAHPGPPSYGPDPGPPPSLAALPPLARRANEAAQWYPRLILSGLSGGGRPGGGVQGQGASPGTYRGPVRLVLTESDLQRVRAGDVMVCAMTSPAWSVVFPVLGAVVTDAGGTLSHPAIIAREYGLPAVVATRVATAELREGQMVTVDGTSGVVTVG